MRQEQIDKLLDLVDKLCRSAKLMTVANMDNAKERASDLNDCVDRYYDYIHMQQGKAR